MTRAFIFENKRFSFKLRDRIKEQVTLQKSSKFLMFHKTDILALKKKFAEKIQITKNHSTKK